LPDVGHRERLGKDDQNAHLEPRSKNRARIRSQNWAEIAVG
jgi:hypothetical protein